MSVGMCLILLGIAITQPANKAEFYSHFGCTQTLACRSKSDVGDVVHPQQGLFGLASYSLHLDKSMCELCRTKC